MFGPEVQALIVTVIFLVLLTAGMAVPFAIAVPAVIYLLMQGGFSALNGLGLMSWGSMNSFALTAVPLFMFMADILSVSGLSNRIYNGLAKLVAPLPGGLLQTNIAGCAIFASVSGSSIATAASIGGVALPQLTTRNYSRQLAAGSLAAYTAWRRADVASTAAAMEGFARVFSSVLPVRLAAGLAMSAAGSVREARKLFAREAGGDLGDLPSLMRV